MGEESPPVLVIDDEKAVCGFFVDLFKVFETKIDVARSGKDGIKKFKAGDYKLVFLDYKLGDMVGTDVLKELREIQPKTTVVLISGYLTDEIIKLLKRIGGDGYRDNPLSAEKSRAYARKYVDKKRV